MHCSKSLQNLLNHQAKEIKNWHIEAVKSRIQIFNLISDGNSEGKYFLLTSGTVLISTITTLDKPYTAPVVLRPSSPVGQGLANLAVAAGS